VEEGRHTERRLAAILSADVCGYSSMMGEDEAGKSVPSSRECGEIYATILL
jgi:class 3 adenylate cyclase